MSSKSRVVEINNYDQQTNFIKDNSQCIIFFGNARCHHCQTMIPVVNEFSQKYPSVGFAHVETSKVKVDNVDGVPVFVGYKYSNPTKVIEGADPESLEEMIQAL